MAANDGYGGGGNSKEERTFGGRGRISLDLETKRKGKEKGIDLKLILKQLKLN